MGRRRSIKTRGLPANLYETNGYFRWRDPRTDVWYGLGRDRRSAISQAIEANHEVEGSRGKRTLVDRLTVGKDNSVSAWCDRYKEMADAKKEAGKIAKATHDSIGQRLAKVRTAWSDMRLDAITTRDVAEFLDTWERDGKARMAQAMRSFLIDFFKAAQTKGWLTSNPADATKAPEVNTMRARLSLDDFKAIHAIAVKDYAPWLSRAMELALLTGLRPEDLAAIGPRDVRDGKLWVIPKKTQKHGVRICMPLTLRLNAVSWSLGEVIGRCKDRVLSRHFLHHSAHAGRAKPGDPIRLKTISVWFAEARDKAGVKAPAGKTPPSFYEIRSLAERLHHDQGVNTQALLGHKQPATTALYHDLRGSEWIEVGTK